VQPVFFDDVILIVLTVGGGGFMLGLCYLLRLVRG
jgi:hypothetical protein